MLAPRTSIALWAAVAAVTAFCACGRREPAPGGGPAPRGVTSAPAEAALPEAGSVPGNLGTPVAPPDNPATPQKVALGHRLFFDARLSADGSVACYSCHQNEHGNGGADPIAIGAKQVSVGMHSPVIWNVGLLPALYWNGRAKTLEELATLAWAGANMGVGKEGLAGKAAEVGKLPEYKADFEAVFPGEGATPATIAKAIAAYERTLVCADTAYDRFAKGDAKALSLAQRRGLGLFLGKGVCTACHTPPLFTSAAAVPGGTYFNVGVGLRGKDPATVDPGRKAVSGRDEDFAAYKPPSLRNVSRSAPYFHDGSVPTLEAAVRYMAEGGTPNRHLSPLLRDRDLTDAEIADLVAFLGALDCGTIEPPPGYVAPREKK